MHALTADQRAALDALPPGIVRDLAQCAVHLYRDVPAGAVVAAVAEWARTWPRMHTIRYPLAYVRASRAQLDRLVERHAVAVRV